MTRVAATALRGDLAETIGRVAFGGERVILERYGKGVVAVVPLADLALLEALEDRVDLDAIRASLRASESEPTVSWEDLKAELGP
jgi:antitoxin (DNA-binding transcriptional repressor) of toxin-antitoxin stability system